MKQDEGANIRNICYGLLRLLMDVSQEQTQLLTTFALLRHRIATMSHIVGVHRHPESRFANWFQQNLFFRPMTNVATRQISTNQRSTWTAVVRDEIDEVVDVDTRVN